MKHESAQKTTALLAWQSPGRGDLTHIGIVLCHVRAAEGRVGLAHWELVATGAGLQARQQGRHIACTVSATTGTCLL